MKNKKYQIVQSKTILGLEKYVNDAISDGRICCGGVSAVVIRGIVVYTQAVVLKNGK